MNSPGPDQADQAQRHFGYVVLLGRPNVGKSTLVNRMVGSKVSIVSRRPQTTRHKVLGVVTHGSHQAAFVDTPGVHGGSQRLLNRAMTRTALSALEDADMGMFLVEGTGLREEDTVVLRKAMQRERFRSVPWLCCLTKLDLVRPRERLLELMSQLDGIYPWQAIIPVSARRGSGVDDLWQLIEAHLPSGPHMFPEDQISDRPLRFMACELIREQLFNQLGDEVPHRVAVFVEQLKEEKRLVRLDASIVVERDGQKAIVIGAGGGRLKSVGSKSRKGLEILFEKKVLLNLWVRVRPNWSNSQSEVRALGYDEG